MTLNWGRDMAKKQEVVTVRLEKQEVDALDELTTGQFSRSAVIRLVLEDFLQKPAKAKRDFLIQRAFS